MNQRDFMNVMMVLAKMDARCKGFQLKSVDESFIDVKSADGTKEYELVCIGDVYYNYNTGRIDVSNAADEVVYRIMDSKEKQKKPEDAVSPAITDIPTEQIMDIFKKIHKDTDDDFDIPDESKEPEKPAVAVKSVIPKPVPAAQNTLSNPKQDTLYDSMLSALDDEEKSAEEELEKHSETASDKNTKDDSNEAGDDNIRQPESDEEKTENSAKKLSGLRSGTGGLMGVMSEVFGLPEAGSAEAAAAAKAEEDKFEI